MYDLHRRILLNGTGSGSSRMHPPIRTGSSIG
jgi:hypothetical protein